MVNIEQWTADFCAALDNTFRNRVLFIGLQGSYSRGEANDKSDIDMVVILDRLDHSDVLRYSEMLDTLSDRELCCGFLSCKEDLANWDAADLFQLFHDTVPLRGDLGALIPEITDEDVVRAIKTGLCSIYHICVHNSVYGKKERTLIDLYKSASFVIQAIVYRETGKFVRTQAELLEKAADSEKPVISEFIRLKNGGKADLAALSKLLFDWVRYRLKDLG